MESKPDKTPLIVLVGETASGKTGLAIELAKQFNGEIIAADSRTVYKHLNIGTAKPTLEERGGIPHHLLDLVEPDSIFSAADFKRLAQNAIQDIANRGHLPILVGGTGLYVDSVIYDFEFRKPGDPRVRERLAKLSVDELQQILIEKKIPLPENKRNPRYLMRAIETEGEPVTPKELRANTLVLGLKIEREVLHHKLAERVDKMVESGFITELKDAVEVYGWDAPGLQSTGYKAFRGYVDGQDSLERAKELFIRNDWQLAKRQRTWFKRNKSIHWICKKDEAVDLITTFLNKVSTAA